jgi:hypothetical protein
MKSFVRIAQTSPRRHVACLFAVLLAWSVVPSSAQELVTSGSRLEPVQLKIHHVVDVAGMGDFKHKSGDGKLPVLSLGPKGTLELNDQSMTFVTGNSRMVLPLQSIRAFSVVRDNVELIPGLPGLLLSFAPKGAGQVSAVFRLNSDTLTLLYVDDNHAVHGSVLLLSKGKGNNVIQTLAKIGLSPRDYPQSGPIAMEAVDKEASPVQTDKKQGRPSLQVVLLTESIDGIPAAYPVGTYEALVTQLTASGLFENVWRQGDSRIDPDALTLHVKIRTLKKGSARVRGMVPFVTPTTLKADVQLTDTAHKVIFDKEIDAAQRTRGENMLVVETLGNKVKKELMKLPDLKPAVPVQTAHIER